MQVVGEPVVKLNTGILKCVVPASLRHQADILSWRFGNNYIYPTKTWSSGKQKRLLTKGTVCPECRLIVHGSILVLFRIAGHRH